MNDTIKIVGSNTYPRGIGCGSECDLKGEVYSGFPHHWVLKTEYSTDVNLKPCFQAFPSMVSLTMHGYIFPKEKYNDFGPGIRTSIKYE